MKKSLGLLGFVLIFAMQTNSASAAVSKAEQAAQIYNERVAAQSYHHRPTFDHRDHPVSFKINTVPYEPPYRSCRGLPGCR
jgi:hypothetical protein